MRCFACLLMIGFSCMSSGRTHAAATPNADKQKAVEVLRKGGIVLFEKFLETQPDMKKKLAGLLQVDEKNLSGIMARKTMREFNKAFVLSDDDAQRILAGRFHDSQNIQFIKSTKKIFKKSGIPLPGVFGYIFDAVDGGTLKQGAELEFSARVVRFVLYMIRNKIGKGAG